MSSGAAITECTSSVRTAPTTHPLVVFAMQIGSLVRATWPIAPSPGEAGAARVDADLPAGHDLELLRRLVEMASSPPLTPSRVVARPSTGQEQPAQLELAGENRAGCPAPPAARWRGPALGLEQPGAGQRDARLGGGA